MLFCAVAHLRGYVKKSKKRCQKFISPQQLGCDDNAFCPLLLSQRMSLTIGILCLVCPRMTKKVSKCEKI